jgi:hypothetical protein
METDMPQRIRALLPRPPYARRKESPAPEAPRVFREFVETLQRLDSAQTPARRKARVRAAEYEMRE